MILDAIQSMQVGDVIAPADFGLAPIQAIHTPDYLDFLQTAYSKWIAEGGSPAGGPIWPTPIARRNY
jgi:acetoin utilization deacetylase AcuC-like enzyme